MSTETPASGAEIARTGFLQFFRPCLVLGLALGLAGRAHAEAPLYETVVTAPDSAGREDASASASVITTDRTPRSAETLPQLLSELPGTAVTSYGSHGALSTLSLRGSSPNQVAIYADGVPLDSALTGAIDLGLVPLGAMARIEVYRGATPLAFGSSAMGGVVSLTSEAPQETGAAVHTGAGSFGTYFGGGELAWVTKRLSVVTRASLFGSRADYPYRTDNGTLFVPGDDQTVRRQNNRLDQIDASARATLTLPARRTVALSLAALDRDQGLPARGTVRSFEARLARRRAYASLSYQGMDDLGTGGRVRALLFGLGAQQRFVDPRGEIVFGGPAQTRDRSLAFGTNVTATWPIVSALHLAGLLDARRESFSPHDELKPTRRPPGSRAFVAGGLSGTLFIDAARLEVTATARAEAARDEISSAGLFAGTPGRQRRTDELLPVYRVGLVARPHEVIRLRANAGSYARLPTLFERYGNGGTVIGSPLLAAERGEVADVGATATFTGDTGALELDAAVFGSRARELIQLEESSYFARYANVSRARILGAEWAAHLRWGRHLRGILQGTWIDARDRGPSSASSGRTLPHQPKLRAYLRPELRDLPLTDTLAFGIYADADWVGTRYMDPSNLVEQSSRRLFGAGASLSWSRVGLRAIGSAYNLGDARENDVLEYPLPGRSFFITLEYSYSRKEPVP